MREAVNSEIISINNQELQAQTPVSAVWVIFLRGLSVSSQPPPGTFHRLILGCGLNASRVLYMAPQNYSQNVPVTLLQERIMFYW